MVTNDGDTDTFQTPLSNIVEVMTDVTTSSETRNEVSIFPTGVSYPMRKTSSISQTVVRVA